MSFWDLLGPALNIAGGVAGYKASKAASKTQRQAAEQASQQFRPYAELGDYAAGELKGRLNKNALLKNFTPGDLTKEPGYRFRQAEGEKAIDRAAGARGSRYSGATLKGLTRFNQDLASQEYGAAYNRDMGNRAAQYNFLAGPMALGQGAAGQQAQWMGAAGDARAAGQVAPASQLWGGLNDAYSVYNTNKYLQNNPHAYLMPNMTGWRPGSTQGQEW